MKVSLAINSKNPVEQWLSQLLKTAEAFDEIVLYIDDFDCSGDTINMVKERTRLLFNSQKRDIKDGFNFAVSNTTGDWVCPFCDDDYFIVGEIKNLISEIKAGTYDDADIIHYPVYTANGRWGAFPDFTYEQIKESNRVPHGSMIRRSAFDALGGYKISPAADWNLWLRAKKAGYRFKYYDRPVYFFREGHERSAWNKQVREIGTEAIRQGVLQNE